MRRWGIEVSGPVLSMSALFHGPRGATPDVVLDIGFGSGEALIELAELNPRRAVIGVDVHTPGVAAVLEAVERRALDNVRVAEGDVLDLIKRIPDASLDEIRVLFPDPWPKRRQRSRRLLRDDVVERLIPLLRQGGILHVATDDRDYAEQICRLCDAHPELRGGVVDRPPARPITRYEQRALDAGRDPIDLIYTVTASARHPTRTATRRAR
jgi:tRNA (guanine-N7-)-methyltransferase